MTAEKKSATESCSRTTAKMAGKGSHRYIVEGYSLLKGMGDGKFVSSDVFTVGGYDWAIQFYPDGSYLSSKYVSVYLNILSKKAHIKAWFDLALLDRSGSGKSFRASAAFPFLFNSNPKTQSTEQGRGWGWKDFIERSKLEKSNYIKEDCLEIICNVCIVKNNDEQPRSFPIPILRANLGNNLKSFLDSGIAYDIVFKIDEETFKAHKLILAARSPVFCAQFYGPIGNPKIDEVVIEDIPPPVFKAMLDFIYSDLFPNFEELNLSSSSSAILAQHLLVAADRYGLDRLKRLCEAELCDELNIDTAASTLDLAEQHNCLHLKSVCKKFIASPKNFGLVMKSEGFQQLGKSSPNLLLELLETEKKTKTSNGRKLKDAFLYLLPRSYRSYRS